MIRKIVLDIIVTFITNGLLYLFQDGQKVCKKGFGHIVEFDDNMTQDDFANFLENIIQSFNLRSNSFWSSKDYQHFYLGLTDREREDEWKWESSGKVFNMTQSREKWGENEPNGHKKEDCAVLLINNKKDYDQYPSLYSEHKYPKINDVNCDRKFTIICQRKVSA